MLCLHPFCELELIVFHSSYGCVDDTGYVSSFITKLNIHLFSAYPNHNTKLNLVQFGLQKGYLQTKLHNMYNYPVSGSKKGKHQVHIEIGLSVQICFFC